LLVRAVAFQHQHTSSGTFALEQARQHFVGAIAHRDAVRIPVVIVNADDVGRHAFPAVIADDGPRGVERFREVIQRLHVVAFRGIGREVGDTPRLVDRDPRDDARMARVALDRRDPFAADALDRVVGKPVRARHLFPDKQA
jgi:hypothetical protein